MTRTAMHLDEEERQALRELLAETAEMKSRGDVSDLLRQNCVEYVRDLYRRLGGYLDLLEALDGPPGQPVEFDHDRLVAWLEKDRIDCLDAARDEHDGRLGLRAGDMGRCFVGYTVEESDVIAQRQIDHWLDEAAMCARLLERAGEEA